MAPAHHHQTVKFLSRHWYHNVGYDDNRQCGAVYYSKHSAIAQADSHHQIRRWRDEIDRLHDWCQIIIWVNLVHNLPSSLPVISSRTFHHVRCHWGQYNTSASMVGRLSFIQASKSIYVSSLINCVMTLIWGANCPPGLHRAESTMTRFSMGQIFIWQRQG